jgi:hypothetical protein
MTFREVRYCFCNAPGCSSRVKWNTCADPPGWMSASSFYGIEAHACPSPECQKWLIEFAAENGLKL